MYTYEMNAGYSVMDASLRMTIPAILDCFQDAAIFEAENGCITVGYLYDRHVAWLLNSWQIVIDRRPKLNERIRVATAPYDFRGFLGYRNFMMTGEDGVVIVRAASIWTLIDTEKHCPSRPTQEMQDGYVLEPRLEMAYAPRKIVLLGDGEAQERFRVRKYQIDSNQHMNNVEYVKLAMETLPEETVIRELRAEYRKAARCGDEVIAVVVCSEGKHQVALKDSTGDIYAVVEFTIDVLE
ncbi:MAG: acyl-[acyl-carrier-protein] thioesterase [Lachnospiraceae bacterium]|nr:acyl-[acyl-carrier-protein] thioesterase [Lachnospiraceae bacterium]